MFIMTLGSKETPYSLVWYEACVDQEGIQTVNMFFFKLSIHRIGDMLQNAAAIIGKVRYCVYNRSVGGGGGIKKFGLKVALNGLYHMHCWRGWEAHLTLFVPESRDWPCHSELLEIFNCSFTTGTSPTIWKRAVILPLKKAGKQPGAIVSYRPVSLTSCVAKTMERICIYIYIYMYIYV